MSKWALLAAAPLLIATTSFFAQSQDPKGWDTLTAAIGGANPNSPDSLKGRRFIIEMPGAGREDSLEVGPSEAFSTTKLADGKFQVEITNPSSMVEGGEIKNFKPISWRIVQVGIAGFGASIEGWATCKYEVRFRQKGGNELALSKLDAEYEVSHEVSVPDQLSTVDRDDRGLAITRRPGSVAPVGIRLRAKARSGTRDYRTAWVPIPACDIPSPKPSPTPSPTPVTNTLTAADCVQLRTVGMSECTERCGQRKTVMNIRFTNVCSRPVRCDPMSWTLSYNGTIYSRADRYWAQLNEAGSADFEVPLAIAPGTQPFRISGPDKQASCRFL